jgi:squalene-hopene/tetraprenyl-beta-curcumene cyclase
MKKIISGIMMTLLLTSMSILINFTYALHEVDKIVYYFDSNNGDLDLGYNGNSPWGISLSTLPEQSGYHLPVREGYMAYEDEYDAFADETEYGFGYYINSQWPDEAHWNWDGTYIGDGTGLPPGAEWHAGKGSRNPYPMKVLVYAPWTGRGCIAVIGDSGPAPWTGRQFGASGKVFDALKLPNSYTRNDGKIFSRGNPNPGHAPNSNTNPKDYPVVLYANNPYWVEFAWADQDALPGPVAISGCPVGYPVIDDDPSDDLYWNVPFNYFGNWYEVMGGFHSGEDWNLVGGDPTADLDKPVYAIADGVVAKISNLGSLGYLIALKHNAPPNHFFLIPGKEGHEHGQYYWYKTEYVTEFYAVYVHVIPREGIMEGMEINRGETIGRIMDPGGGPHLHFEIRHPDAKNSPNWSLVGDPSNWAQKDGKYTGYYLDIQKMVDAGVRDPRDFILANSIFAGIQWLRNHQNTDGSWQSSVGITSMAVLTFLNAGYDENDPTVSSAIQYILANRRGDGSFGWGTYETSTAIWALVATHNPNYHDEIAQAKDWLILAQYDEGEGATLDSACYGGWRYGSSPGDGDLSNTQFALMALDAAYSELGLEKPDPNDPSSWSFKAVTFISRCQNRPASNDQPWSHDTTRPSYNDGGFIYYPGGWSLAGGTDSYGSMTAAGIWSLRLCGVAVADERVQAGLNWLTNNEDCSFDDNPGHPYDQAHCFLYYYYMTIAKALTMCFLHDLGEVDWYAALSAKLIALQLEDGHWVNAPASHGMEDISELATDYALLALQVKQPPPAKLWMSIILASNAELCVYDPQGRHARLDDVTIPGATFEIDEEGRQIVNLTELEAGKYTIELRGIADGDYSLAINGYRDEEQTFSKTFEGTIKKGETLVGSALVTSMVGALTIYTENPIPPPDAIPPTTILSIGEPKYVTDTIYVTPDTPFLLDATDNPGGSGVALTAYKIRNATYDSSWLTYTETFYLTGLTDGVYAIDYNSTDNANNVEPTNTINVTLFSWNYIFTDSYGRGTTLKINTAHKFFQFMTPDKDYGIKKATYMRIDRRTITMLHEDKQLKLITLAVDTKLDFCAAIAWDKQTRKQYLLIDKPGFEK